MRRYCQRRSELHTAPTEADLYCSGVATDQASRTDTYMISGENSNYKNTFLPGDYVYINRGAEQGVKVGDEFEVVRPDARIDARQVV